MWAAARDVLVQFDAKEFGGPSQEIGLLLTSAEQSDPLKALIVNLSSICSDFVLFWSIYFASSKNFEESEVTNPNGNALNHLHDVG